MPPDVAQGAPRTLFSFAVRRAATSGRFFLVYGALLSTVLGVVLSVSSRAGLVSGFPILVPIFGIVGAMGGLVVFTNDRLKGVLEYLLSYGVSPRRIFALTLEASLVLVSVVLGVALTATIGVNVAQHGGLPVGFYELVLVYTLPMSYSSVAFATVLGIYWTSLSSPRAGMNSPIGLIPFLGILPSVAVLGGLIVTGVLGIATPEALLVLTGTAVGTLVVVVIILVSQVDRLLRRERLLSAA